MPHSDWEKFFQHHAPVYMDNVFTKNTRAEVAFIVRELNLKEGNSILDIGCGTGRHSVELARQGFRMTGVDLSEAMLAEAKKAANKAGVDVEFIHSNAAKFVPTREYDAAISLCEGAFSLFGKDEDPFTRDLAILGNIHKALKPGGMFLMTVLSALRHIRLYNKEDIAAGTFDPYLLIEYSKQQITTKNGEETVTLREKGYTAGELILLMRQSGFEILDMWGGTAGAWNKAVLDPDEYEIMLRLKKKS